MKTDVLEFQLKDHPARLTVGFEKKKIIRRKRDFFVSLDSGVIEDRETFRRSLAASELVLNGHRGKDLAGFSPAFATPEAEALLTSIHEARPEIVRLEQEKAQAFAEAAIMKVAAEENDNPNSVKMFFEQIESRERAAKLLQMKIETMRRKLANDQKRLLELLSAESAKEYASELEVVRTETGRANDLIMQGYRVIADRIKPAVRKLSELGHNCGKEFSAETGYFDTQVIQTPAQVYHFDHVPSLKLTDNALRFALRNNVPQAPQQGGKK